MPRIGVDGRGTIPKRVVEFLLILESVHGSINVNLHKFYSDLR